MTRFARVILFPLMVLSMAMPAMGQEESPVILIGHQGPVGGVGFFPDGKTVATAGFDGTIRIWEAKTGKMIRILPGSSGGISDLDISPDGTMIATANFKNKTARVWNVKTGRLLIDIGAKKNVIILAFTADGKHLMIGDSTPKASLVDLDGKRKLNEWTVGSRVATSRDGKYAAISGSGGANLGASLHLVDLRTRKIRWVSRQPGAGSYVAFSPDSKLVAVGDKAGKVVFHDVAKGFKTKSLIVGDKPIDGLAFTPDGRLATGCWDKLVKLWDVKTGKLLHTFSGHTHFVFRIAVSPDGRQIISGSADGTARVWTIPGANTIIAGKIPTGTGVAPAVPAALGQPVNPAKERAAIPAAGAQKEALTQIRQLFNLSNAQSLQKKVVTANSLLEVADDTVELPSRFVLLDQARLLAAAGHDIDLALSAAVKLGSEFKIDLEDLKLNTIIAASNAGADKKLMIPMIDHLIDQAIKQDQYDQANEIVQTAVRLARLSRNQSLIRQTTRRRSQILRAKQVYDQALRSLAAIEKNPKDAKAQLAVGKYFCFLKGDWKAGLPALAEGSDVQLRILARQELIKPTSAIDQMKLADRWWSYGNTQSGYIKDAVRSRAALWYRSALPGLKGLTKIKVQQRLEAARAP